MPKAGVTKQTIWQRLRDEHGLVASVASLKRYVAANLPEEGMRARVTVLRGDPSAAIGGVTTACGFKTRR